MWRLGVPIWREGRAALEGVRLSVAPPEPGACAGLATGRPVLLIPGYLGSDRALGPLARCLRRDGHVPCHAGISVNVDCATRTVERLAGSLHRLVRTHGEPAVIVGHSLGGVLGRVLAVRRPDLVRTVVCLGSPLKDLAAVHPLVTANVRFVRALGDLGVPGVLSSSCLDGACCAETRRLAAAPFPEGVDFLSVFSRTDGIVDWRSCLDPWADHVEVDSSHIGMPLNAAVHRVVLDRLTAAGDAGEAVDDLPRAA